MDKEIDIKLRQFIAAVAKQYPKLLTTYVFGSYAKGMQTDESDVDIALVFEHFNNSDEFDIQVELMLLASRLDLRIEPHPLLIEDVYSGNPFAAEVVRTGIETKPETATAKLDELEADDYRKHLKKQADTGKRFINLKR